MGGPELSSGKSLPPADNSSNPWQKINEEKVGEEEDSRPVIDWSGWENQVNPVQPAAVAPIESVEQSVQPIVAPIEPAEPIHEEAIFTEEAPQDTNIDTDKDAEHITEEAEAVTEIGTEDAAEKEAKSPEELLLTSEGRIELNEGFFNELSTVKRVIAEKRLDSASNMDKLDSANLIVSSLRGYLDSGVTSHIHGAKLTEDGHAVDAFVLKKYEEALADYKKLIADNPGLLDEAKNLEAKPVSASDFEEQLAQAKTHADITRIHDQAIDAQEIADMKTMYELRGINYNERSSEISIEEHDRLMEEYKKGLEAAEATIAKYDTTSPIKKFLQRLNPSVRSIIVDAREQAAGYRQRMAQLDNDRFYKSALRYLERHQEENQAS